MGPEVAIIAQVVGTVISAVGSLRQGQAADQQAKYQAAQMEVQAGQERASSQREALEQKRQSTFLQSRATNLAAAGGGTALDPTVVDILGGLEAEGDYRAGTAIYEGEESARNLEGGATLKRYEGKQALQAGKRQAVGTLFSGIGGSLFSKYGSPSDTAGATTTSSGSRAKTEAPSKMSAGGYEHPTNASGWY